jgi:hypothetical protein
VLALDAVLPPGLESARPPLLELLVPAIGHLVPQCRGDPTPAARPARRFAPISRQTRMDAARTARCSTALYRCSDLLRLELGLRFPSPRGTARDRCR